MYFTNYSNLMKRNFVFFIIVAYSKIGNTIRNSNRILLRELYFSLRNYYITNKYIFTFINFNLNHKIQSNIKYNCFITLNIITVHGVILTY